MLYSLSIKLNISEALVFYSHRISKKKKNKPQSWFNIYISNSCWNRQMFLFLQNLIFIIGNRSLCLNFSILLWYALSILPNKGKGEDTMSVLEELLVWLGEGKRCCGVLYPFLGCLGNNEWTEDSITTAFIWVSSWQQKWKSTDVQREHHLYRREGNSQVESHMSYM